MIIHLKFLTYIQKIEFELSEYNLAIVNGIQVEIDQAKFTFQRLIRNIF